MKKIIVLILIALMQVHCGAVLAQPAATPAVTDAALAAQREAELLSRLHGTRSARGMVVNDVAALKNIRLEPVQLRNGQYMLRAIDTTTGQFVKVSHPSVKAMMRDIGARRFATAEAAQASAPSHKGWLTRTASELERTYRGRLGGLQTEINKVQAQRAPPSAPATDAAAPKPATTTNTPKPPVVADSGTTVAKPATPGTGSGAPNPAVSTVAASETVVPNSSTTPATSGSTSASSGTGSGAPKPATDVKVTDPKPANPSTTAAATSEAVVPQTRMARAGSAVKGALKGSLASIPIMLATGLAVDLANQHRREGFVSFEKAATNLMSPEFLGAMMGSVTGGTLGNIAGTMLSGLPFGSFLKMAATIGGAAMGANLGSGTQIDWGRLLFTTAITAAVAAAGPAGWVGFGLVAGSGFAADKLYDWLFKRNQNQNRQQPRTRTAASNQNPPTPPANTTGTGANPPPPPPPTPTPTPTPTTVAVQPPPGNQAPAPRTIAPPIPPDKSDLYGDLPYR